MRVQGVSGLRPSEVHKAVDIKAGGKQQNQARLLLTLQELDLLQESEGEAVLVHPLQSLVDIAL